MNINVNTCEYFLNIHCMCVFIYIHNYIYNYFIHYEIIHYKPSYIKTYFYWVCFMQVWFLNQTISFHSHLTKIIKTTPFCTFISIIYATY